MALTSTSNSRQVLAECKYLLGLLEEEGDGRLWRIYWVAAVALLAAVGDVLERIDGRDASVRKMVKKLRGSWIDKSQHSHSIYRDFIRHERNNVIHEFAFGVSEGPVALGIGNLNGPMEMHILDENFYRPMRSGAFRDEDAHDLIAHAVEWWTAQLDSIDRAI